MGLTALCPGTFDPVTNGHLDIIERAARRFDAVVVGVLDNAAKQPLFPVEDRVRMLEELTGGLPGVEVDRFSGLLVDFAKRRKVDVVVKGLRSEADFAYEQQMAQMNRHVGDVETAVRWKINAVTVVNNNGGGNQSKRGFDRVYGGTQTEQARELWTFRKTNFARIAEEMGAVGIRVEDPKGLPAALAQGLAANRPVIIDVATDIDALAPVAVT